MAVVDVGIRELRNNLSRYLDEVRAGTEITVTDRGTAIAKIVPTGTRTLDALIAEGIVTRPTRPKNRPERLVAAKGPVSEFVAEQRR